MITNYELRKKAKESLQGQWGLAVGTIFVYDIIIYITSTIYVNFFLEGPFELGISILFLNIIRDKYPHFNMLFKGFNNFGKALGLYLLKTLYIFLWALLLIIPGIIVSYSYSLVFFILADEPEISITGALKKSKEMMYGYKWQLFWLEFGFIGWVFLSLLTLGIGFLWLIPYMQTTYAHFYEERKKEYEENIINQQEMSGNLT